MAENRSPLDEHDTREVPNTARQQPSRSPRWGLWLPLIVISLGIVGYFGVQWWLYSLSHVSTDDARVKGTLITVSSQVPGRLVTVAIQDGQHIKQGDLIAQIQQDDYHAQVALREAALEAVQSQLTNAEADWELAKTLAEGHIERSDAVLGASRSQLAEAEKAVGFEDKRIKAALQEKEASVEEVKAQIAGAKASLDKATADLERSKQLFRDGIIAAEQRDQAAAVHDQALARYQFTQETLNRSLALLQITHAESNRVQLMLDTVRTQQRKVRESAALKSLAVAERQRVPMKEEVVKNLRAKVKEARAQLDLAHIQLAETRIISPIDGVVSQTIADAGERVQPGQPIAIINDPKDVWIEANIEETHFRKVRSGQPVAIDVDAYPARTFQGQVAQLGAATRSEFAIIPAGSASAHFIKVTQRIPVRIAVDNREELLKPGMMAVVGIRVK